MPYSSFQPWCLLLKRFLPPQERMRRSPSPSARTLHSRTRLTFVWMQRGLFVLRNWSLLRHFVEIMQFSHLSCAYGKRTLSPSIRNDNTTKNEAFLVLMRPLLAQTNRYKRFIINMDKTSYNPIDTTGHIKGEKIKPAKTMKTLVDLLGACLQASQEEQVKKGIQRE